MFCISKSSRVSHKEPALQGTGATVIVWCRRTGLDANLRPVAWVFPHPGRPVGTGWSIRLPLTLPSLSAVLPPSASPAEY